MICELCELKVKNDIVYEDEYFIVLPCLKHPIDMIVLKRHDIELNQEEIIDLMFVLNKLNLDNIKKLSQKRKSIFDHWHLHLTPYNYEEEN